MRPLLALSALSCLLVLAAAARAEEPAPPPFTVEDVAPGDDDRPEGWSPLLEGPALPANAPTVKNLLALAGDDFAIAARSRSLVDESGAAGVLSVVGVDAKGEAFTSALADAAVKHGWLVRELGDPRRVAVVWCATKEKAAALLAWQAHLAVRRLVARGRRKVTLALGIRVQGRPDFHAIDEAIASLGPAARIEPAAATLHMVLGQVYMALGKADRELAAYRHVIAPDAPLPVSPAGQRLAAGRVGHILLVQGKAEVLPEALAALLRAVELEEHARSARDVVDAFGNRYNLACTYARLGRKDEAFEQLERSLAMGKRVLGADYASHFEHARSVDPDMASLRDDPRFAALMAKWDPAPAQKEPPGDLPDK